MARYSGGECVGAGTYWNLESGKVVDLRKGGVLPECEGSQYLRVPFVLAFLAVIALGGVYIVCLPVVIVGTAIYVAAVRIFGSLFLQVRKSVFFGWRPSEAYLSGRNREKKENGKAENGKADKGDAGNGKAE